MVQPEPERGSAVCPVLLRQRHEEGCCEVKNSECDRPEAGVTRGHRETSFLLFLIRVSSVEAITAC